MTHSILNELVFADMPKFKIFEASNPKRLTVIDALCQLFTVRDRILDRLPQTWTGQYC